MHYLITRFSIHEPSWEGPGATGKWLQHRWPLFERCALSVEVAKDNADFEWLMLCHHKMPQKWFDRLGERFQESPVRMRIIKVGRNWLRDLQDWLNGGKDESIITTRLDSDDLVGYNFLKAVQRADSSAVRYFIDAPHGYKEVDGKVRDYSERNNPFLSYVETEGPFRSAYFIEHGSRVDKHVVVRIKGRHWIQVIHDRNQRNKA